VEVAVHAGQPVNETVELFPGPWQAQVPAGQEQTTEQLDPYQDELHPPSVSDVPPPPLSRQLWSDPLPDPDPEAFPESSPADASGGGELSLDIPLGASTVPPLDASVAPESLPGVCPLGVDVEPPHASAIAAA
jgi:hypothetical protein